MYYINIYAKFYVFTVSLQKKVQFYYDSISELG